MQSRLSRKSRRKYRLFSVIITLTVIAGLSGFYLGWWLFTAITTRPAAVVEAPGKGSSSRTDSPGSAQPTDQTSAQTGAQPTDGSSADKPTGGAVAGSVTFSPTALTIYSFQVGSFDQDRLARAEASRLQARGQAAYVLQLPSSPPPYKVRIGAFSDKTAAATFSASLKKAGQSGFVTSLAVASAPVTWRGSDAAHLGRVKTALDEVSGLLSAEAGWYDAYFLKKSDRAEIESQAEPWRDRLSRAALDLGGSAVPSDLATLGSRTADAVKLAGESLEAVIAFAGSGTQDLYDRSVAAYVVAVEGFRFVLAWEGNR